jgi:hypothetical protein
LTFSIASRTLFNVEIDKHTEELGKAITTALSSGNIFWIGWSIPFLRSNLPLTPYGRFYRAKATVDRSVAEIIAERRASGADTGGYHFYVVPQPLITLRPRHEVQMREEETRVPFPLQ